MKSFELFFPDLMPLVPQCPEPTAERALLRASQRFCELTLAWRVALDPVLTAAGIDEYDMPLETTAELVRIEKAMLAGREIQVSTPNGCISRHRSYIECTDGKIVIINPVPAVDDVELLITASVKPSNTSTSGVEDFLYDRHCTVIANGAAALLKQQPGKTYSAGDGLMWWDTFEKRCATIKQQVWRGNARNTPRTIPNFF